MNTAAPTTQTHGWVYHVVVVVVVSFLTVVLELLLPLSCANEINCERVKKHIHKNRLKMLPPGFFICIDFNKQKR
jgi:hypothetical protein